MAEKEVTIKVTTEADASQVEDLGNVLDNVKGKADETGQALQEAFEEATARVEELTDELANIEMGESDADFDEVSSQLSEAEEEAERLNDALGNINGSGLDDASNSADNLSNGLSNVSENADNLSNSMGLIDSAVLMDLANQVGQIGDQAEGMAQDMNTAAITVGQLATNTGIAEPQLVSMINAMTDADFPHADALAYVNALNQMGVSAGNLRTSAEAMDTISDATGLSTQKTISLTQSLRGLGISADNLPSAFNSIAYAEANVTGGADSLTTVLKRQAGTLNEYGLTADQTVIILQRLSESGVQQMKLGSTLSQILKDNNGDLRAVEQQLGLTSGTLQNASDITKQYEGRLESLADEEGQHKTILDQLNAGWEDLSLALSPVIEPMMSVLGLVGQFGQFAIYANAIVTLAETLGILEEGQLALIPVQYAEGTAGWFSIGWIALAILLGIALGLALVYLWNNSEQFRNGVIALGNGLKWLAGVIVSSIMGAVNRFKQLVWGIPKALSDCLNWANQMIMNHPIVKNIIWLGQQIAKVFSQRGLNQHSPGDLYKALKLDMDAMDDEVTGSDLPVKMQRLGGSLSANFNPTVDNINDTNFSNEILATGFENMDSLGKSEVNNIFNIDYLAKREFVQEIIDIIQNEVNWNNSTAGRSV